MDQKPACEDAREREGDDPQGGVAPGDREKRPRNRDPEDEPEDADRVAVEGAEGEETVPVGPGRFYTRLGGGGKRNQGKALGAGLA